MSARNDVDCCKGREMGCDTYCCRLLIRLEEDERPLSVAGEVVPGFVEKADDGFCIHLDRDNYMCAIWHNRPRVCREYSCNRDPLLQVALREPYSSMVDLVKKEQNIFIPVEAHIQIPCCDEDDVTT